MKRILTLVAVAILYITSFFTDQAQAYYFKDLDQTALPGLYPPMGPLWLAVAVWAQRNRRFGGPKAVAWWAWVTCPAKQ